MCCNPADVAAWVTVAPPTMAAQCCCCGSMLLLHSCTPQMLSVAHSQLLLCRCDCRRVCFYARAESHCPRSRLPMASQRRLLPDIMTHTYVCCFVSVQLQESVCQRACRVPHCLLSPLPMADPPTMAALYSLLRFVVKHGHYAELPPATAAFVCNCRRVPHCLLLPLLMVPSPSLVLHAACAGPMALMLWLNLVI
jgi:hypothetical protein